MPDRSVASAAARDLVNLRYSPGRTELLAARVSYVVKRVAFLTDQERADLLEALNATAAI